MKNILLLLFVLFFVQVHSTTKEKALHNIRLFYAEKPYKQIDVSADSVKMYRALLDENGIFKDLLPSEILINKKNYAVIKEKQPFISAVTKQAFNRIWMIAETFRNKKNSVEDTIVKTLFKSILHYGELENNRLNVSSRWHISCFAIPTATTHIYFSLFDIMLRIEKGELKEPLFVEGHKILGEVSRQCWTVPARMDETDDIVISVDRFRKHVWWVGGNATDYRPLLQTAAQLSSSQMADIVGEVAVRSISSVSQTTIQEDFWQEGITVDGAGWGHGMQCLVWGYPIHGTMGSLRILKVMKDYPLPIELKQEQMSVLLDYQRGSSFYYYKGYTPPVVDRGNMNRLERPYPGRIGNKESNYRYRIPSKEIAQMLTEHFADKLSRDMKDECHQFIEEAEHYRIGMKGEWNKYYSGSRYFFNNDDIIKKTDRYYVLVNMASNRVSGLESAKSMAASFNIFTCDGTTLFFREGNEYQRVLGAFNLRTWPGTTSRLSSELLVPIENWNGYNSRYSFAAGVTNGGNSFAGGFIFEKNDRRWQKNNKPYSPEEDPNPSAFGVKAYKSYFMFDDLFLAMGCGIENKMPHLKGDIVTTIDQTALNSDFTNDSQVLNNGFYYKVLDQYTAGKVVVKHEKRKTNWQSMCIENKLPETEEDIFHMYINHGCDIEDASYAYTVSCSEGSVYQTPQVLSNTKEVQAAESYDGNKIGMIFYEKTRAVESSRGYFKVSAPCALLIEFVSNKKVSISVTDALMDSQIQDIFIETSIPLKGENVNKLSENTYQIIMHMKTGRYTGAPVSLDVDLISSEK